MPKPVPPLLPAAVARPLLAAAERIVRIAPWSFMSDLELIGMREDDTGKLHLASILGTLGTMFAVVIYRNDAGLRGIHELVSTRAQPDAQAMFEGMDYLKVEWCRKGDLRKADLQTLSDAGFKPRGKGAIWPRFESSLPGWYPWGMTVAEAVLMTELLAKVGRFVGVREKSGPLHEEPLEARVPIIPSGEETTLRAEDIEWFPLVLSPAPMPEPLVLSAVDEERLKRLPLRDGFVAEMIAPLVPEMAFLDESAGRPCIPRSGFIMDCHSGMILCTRLAHGAAPLKEAVGPSLLEALGKAKARPVAIRVDDERLGAVLQPACAAIDIRVEIAALKLAPVAWQDFESYLQNQYAR